MLGPVFAREFRIAPQRIRFYLARGLYPAGLLVLLLTAFQLVAGTQLVTNIGDLARFGTLVFQFLVLAQLALALIFPALWTAGAVAIEKDRGTLVLLLMTRVSSLELVLGKLLGSLLQGLVVLLAALPVFMFLLLLGGVALWQVLQVFAITLSAAVLGGSLGVLMGFWRERTFQALALTLLAIFAWIALGEVIASGLLGEAWLGIATRDWATWISPWQAVQTAAAAYRPRPDWTEGWGLLSPPVGPFLIFAASATLVCIVTSILGLRRWAIEQPRQGADERETLARPAEDSEEEGEKKPPVAALPPINARAVWNWTILWREVRTWAYGRRVLIVRVIYLLAALALGTWLVLNAGPDGSLTRLISAYLFAPFGVLSLLLINALAVNSFTSERDGRTLDLLLVSELSPREIVIGKLIGTLYNTLEMVLAPAIVGFLFWMLRDTQGARVIDTQELTCLLIGWAAVVLFVAVLGLHCGMIYLNSRTSMAVSLGTVIFLVLGVAACLRLIVAFGGSFNLQLLPFAFFIGGGGLALFLSLGIRNPSPAIGVASFLLPLATFYAITSFLLDKPPFVAAVVVLMYGFAATALLIPALSELDVASAKRTDQLE
jgi:ABC-type transport system involved in multi-copper enzyme maturation permease subunit